MSKSRSVRREYGGDGRDEQFRNKLKTVAYYDFVRPTRHDQALSLVTI